MQKRKKPRVLMIDVSQILCPLDNTLKKKFSLFSEVSKNYYLAFSADRKFRKFSEFAEFYLIPSQLPLFLKHFLFLLSVFGITIYLVMKKGVSIVITTTPLDGFPVALARGFLRVMGKRIVTIVQAQGDWEKAPSLLNKYPEYYVNLMAIMSDISLKSADITRAVSAHTAEKVKGKVNKPCFVFSSFTDFELFNKDNHEETEYTENAKTILYAGSLTSLKGVHILIRAMKTVLSMNKDVKLVIVGKGDYRETLEKLVDELAINDHVEFRGYLIQHNDLAVYMRKCFMFVLPSLSEGLPRVLIEAMSCGKPVIGSGVGGIVELIQDGHNGFLVRPGNPEDIAEKILTLLAEPEKARQMGENGKSFAIDRFSTNIYLKNYEGLINKAMDCYESKLNCFLTEK